MDKYYKSVAWKSLRWKCLKRDHFCCWYCGFHGRYGHGLQAHHIWPRDYGGADDLSNLITVCVPCHDRIEPERGKSYSKLSVWAENESDRVWVSEPAISEPAKPWEWQKWVYGGFANPFKGSITEAERTELRKQEQEMRLKSKPKPEQKVKRETKPKAKPKLESSRAQLWYRWYEKQRAIRRARRIEP